jgi:hypothetical protein
MQRKLNNEISFELNGRVNQVFPFLKLTNELIKLNNP